MKIQTHFKASRTSCKRNSITTNIRRTTHTMSTFKRTRFRIWQKAKRSLWFSMITIYKSLCLTNLCQRGRTSFKKSVKSLKLSNFKFQTSKIRIKKSFRSPTTKFLSLRRKSRNFKSSWKNKLSKTKL